LTKIIRLISFLVIIGSLVAGMAAFSSAQEINDGIIRPTAITLDVSNGKMYWSNVTSGRVLRANLDGTESEIVVCNFRCAGLVSQILAFNVAEALTLNSRSDQIFWSDTLGGQIWRANLDGSEAVGILCDQEPCENGFVVDDFSEPLSLAADPNRSHIYWTDGGSDRIRRANLDGSEVENLICRESCSGGVVFEGIDRPVSIALDLTEGRIYWTEPLSSYINRANLNGSDAGNFICRSEDQCEGGVVFPSLLRPAGIAVDSNNGMIYWTDQLEARIQRANLDGSEIENVLCAEECEGGFVNSILDSPQGIVVDGEGGKFYWVDSDDNYVGRANLDGSESEILICMSC